MSAAIEKIEIATYHVAIIRSHVTERNGNGPRVWHKSVVASTHDEAEAIARSWFEKTTGFCVADPEGDDPHGYNPDGFIVSAVCRDDEL